MEIKYRYSISGHTVDGVAGTPSGDDKEIALAVAQAVADSEGVGIKLGMMSASNPEHQMGLNVIKPSEGDVDWGAKFDFIELLLPGEDKWRRLAILE